MLFDVDTMKKVMLEFELDMEKMPLGKLSQKQLKSAMKVLSEISDLIAIGGSNPQFIDASNRFYSFIPHNFGIETHIGDSILFWTLLNKSRTNKP